ncbi:MAG: hypothetical protein FD123_3146 [Bacteroidetes bacterium]|nr:MAG: hypothetical protein FD123_3146 [Bacteroidota bacterium]
MKKFLLVLPQHKQDPARAAAMNQVASQARAWLEAHPETRQQQNRTSVPLLTIPTVVHVLYKNATQNISDQQVYSQIASLNADYRRLNADTVNTLPVFDTLAADIEIEFCLATVDPQGNPTNGITRTSTAGGQLFGYFSPLGEDAKFDSTGGKTAWPTDKYLNLWVCELFPGLLGYAQFPGDAASTDGVVITYTAFGTLGTVTAPSTRGRTASHEVGHWMGLFHIWGDDSDCTTGSDSIADTPNASSQSQSDCQLSLNSCSNEDPWWGVIDPPDNVQNYMDYSNDSCMNMFTLGQKARMHSFLYGDPRRAALFTSNGGCNPVLVKNNTFDNYFSVYPNPSDGIMNVSYFGTFSPEMHVTLFDNMGRQVRAWAAQEYIYTLDMGGLPSGIYFLRFQGEGGVGVKKITLQ